MFRFPRVGIRFWPLTGAPPDVHGFQGLSGVYAIHIYTIPLVGRNIVTRLGQSRHPMKTTLAPVGGLFRTQARVCSSVALVTYRKVLRSVGSALDQASRTCWPPISKRLE